jgi:hypothetical protein
LSITHLIYLISGENDGADHLEEANSALNKFKTLNLPQYSTMNAIILHFSGEYEIAKNEFSLSAENNPISKRNLEKLYFADLHVNSNQNPLSKILFSSTNMFDLFLNRTDIVADTTTKYLNSFANTVLDSKFNNGVEIKRFNNKSLQKKIYISTFNSNFETLTEAQLISFADKIYNTNLYRYYTFNDWVVRYDASNVKTVFLITEL